MKRVAALFAALMIFLCSCSPYSQGGYELDPGDTLTPEMLESIFEEGTEPAPVTTEKIVLTDDTLVYYTPGGTKYHIFSDCTSLSRSKEVIEAKRAEVIALGKEECCKNCEKKAGLSQ